ncbi:MAG TPA: ATP12 family protein [Caulobacteraceae bacterium]|nr:ATP12 family protein [Caulobacteraceae bacterium]
MSLPGHQSERRKRFYATADVGPMNGGFGVRLDGRTPKSPAGVSLVLPTEALAQLVAAEWAAQGEHIDPVSMPATRLAWAALALDEAGRAAAVERVASFAGTDLLCYFADWPSDLLERQERRWGPVIAWADAALGVTFHRTQGIIHQPQPQGTLDRIAELAATEDAFTLTGLAEAAALFGSAMLAFALRRSELTADAAFDLSRLDEIFQEERWGVDAEAAARADRMAKEAVALGRWFWALLTAGDLAAISARRLARMGGIAPDLEVPPRRRSDPT